MTLSLALIFPVVLTMVMLVVQAALWWYADQAALTAAREGADAGRSQGALPGAAEKRAYSFLTKVGDLAKPATSTPVSATSDGTTFRVTVTVRPLSVVPGLDGLVITQRVSAPVEQFVEPGAQP